jgi:hypothetical protein
MLRIVTDENNAQSRQQNPSKPLISQVVTELTS